MESVASIESVEATGEHLETKKQIESLRNKYGETWLQSFSGSLVQDVLGMPKLAKPLMSSSPYEEDFRVHAVEVIVEKIEEPVVETVENNKDVDKADVVSDMSTNNTFVTASESSLFGDKETLTSDSASITSDEEQVEGKKLFYKIFLHILKNIFTKYFTKYFLENG